MPSAKVNSCEKMMYLPIYSFIGLKMQTNMLWTFLYEIFVPPKVSSFKYKGYIGTSGEAGNVAG